MNKKNCDHEKCKPEYDSELAKNMTSIEVRKHFPRFFGKCPDCNEEVIYYASTEHFVMGDW